mgnify:CR=1 FL=1
MRYPTKKQSNFLGKKTFFVGYLDFFETALVCWYWQKIANNFQFFDIIFTYDAYIPWYVNVWPHSDTSSWYPVLGFLSRNHPSTSSSRVQLNISKFFLLTSAAKSFSSWGISLLGSSFLTPTSCLLFLFRIKSSLWMSTLKKNKF